MGTTIQSTLNATPPQEGVGATKETFLVNNNFVSGDVLRLTDTGAWAKASASATATSAWIGVVERSWSDRFRVVYAGKCELPNHGFAIGAALYLTNAGGLSTAAGSIPKLVGVVTSDRHIVVGNRGGEATVPVATTDGAGIVELTTVAEGVAGVDTTRAMTAAATNAAIDNKVPLATTAAAGKVQRATEAEVTEGTNTEKYVTPATNKAALDARLVDASETEKGLTQFSTTVETNAGTNDTKAVTPLKLSGFFADRAATPAEVDAGTEGGKYITPATLANRLAVGAGSVSGRTIYVDNGCPSATNSRGAASPYNAAIPFVTISAAIAAAAAGDTVYVARGSADYTLAASMTVPTNFALIAEPGARMVFTGLTANGTTNLFVTPTSTVSFAFIAPACYITVNSNPPSNVTPSCTIFSLGSSASSRSYVCIQVGAIIHNRTMQGSSNSASVSILGMSGYNGETHLKIDRAYLTTSGNANTTIGGNNLSISTSGSGHAYIDISYYAGVMSTSATRTYITVRNWKPADGLTGLWSGSDGLSFVGGTTIVYNTNYRAGGGSFDGAFARSGSGSHNLAIYDSSIQASSFCVRAVFSGTKIVWLRNCVLGTSAEVSALGVSTATLVVRALNCISNVTLLPAGVTNLFSPDNCVVDSDASTVP